MTDTAKLRTRAATIADAAAMAEIYNQGIADRIATFETEPRSAADMAAWFVPGLQPVMRGKIARLLG